MNLNISIIGIGYIGLPLAVEFSKFYKVTAFDIDKKRIQELKKGIDKTREIKINKKNINKKINFTNNEENLKQSNIFIIAVPTPIKKNNNPNLSYLKNASKIVGKNMKKSSVVIYESTVFPGCTEEFCAPILEKSSGLKLNKGFFLGYSPERINPGLSKNKLTNTIKIVSGSNKYSLKLIKNLYKKIIKAGVHVADKIKVAEAAKVIENIQRDINIALINECSLIFKKLNINTSDVLKAAETKWNFTPFKPGLVGGHCIGVDPYYLTYKAKKVNYNPEVILSGRNINNSMALYVTKKILKTLNINFKNKKVLILGLAFKENCVDTRNSKIFDIVNYLQKKNVTTHVYDPLVDYSYNSKNYKITLLKKLKKKNYYDIIVYAVPHKIFNKIDIKTIKSFGNKNLKIFDLKSFLPKKYTDWQL